MSRLFPGGFSLSGILPSGGGVFGSESGVQAAVIYKPREQDMKRIFYLAMLIFLLTAIPAYGDYTIYCKDGRKFFVKNYEITEVDVTYITDYGIFHLPLKEVDITKTEYERDLADHGPKWRELQRKAEEKRTTSLKEEPPKTPPGAPAVRPEAPSGPQIVFPPSAKTDTSLELDQKLKELKDKLVDIARTLGGLGAVSASYYGSTAEILWDRTQWNNIPMDKKEKCLSAAFEIWSRAFNKTAGTLMVKDYSTGDILAKVDLYSSQIDGKYFMK